MFRIFAYECLGGWHVTFTRIPTLEERAQGESAFAESALIQRKEGRPAELDAMQAIEEAMSFWFRMLAERTP
jgi:hypothetical protein